MLVSIVSWSNIAGEELFCFEATYSDVVFTFIPILDLDSDC